MQKQQRTQSQRPRQSAHNAVREKGELYRKIEFSCCSCLCIILMVKKLPFSHAKHNYTIFPFFVVVVDVVGFTSLNWRRAQRGKKRKSIPSKTQLNAKLFAPSASQSSGVYNLTNITIVGSRSARGSHEHTEAHLRMEKRAPKWQSTKKKTTHVNETKNLAPDISIPFYGGRFFNPENDNNKWPFSAALVQIRNFAKQPSAEIKIVVLCSCHHHPHPPPPSGASCRMVSADCRSKREHSNRIMQNIAIHRQESFENQLKF